VLLPLLVFCIARSRLPLYLLPVFVPLALVVARQSPAGSSGLPRWPLLAAWALVLLAVRIGAAHLQLRPGCLAMGAGHPRPRLRAHPRGGVRGGHAALRPAPVPGHGSGIAVARPARRAGLQPEYDESLATELAEAATETGVVYVVKQKLWTAVETRVLAHGYRALRQGQPFHGRVFFMVERR
jgi:hypothetical protein